MTPLIDLIMLAVADGRERDVDEYHALLAEAGLRPNTVTRTATQRVILEASWYSSFHRTSAS